MSSKDTITKEYMSKRLYFANMGNDKMTFLLLGIENQSEVHCAMPVRNLLYDALNYGHQVSEIASEHRKEKDLRDAEFLSGFSKEDKIIPVITLTVYFGSDIVVSEKEEVVDMCKGLEGYGKKQAFKMLVSNVENMMKNLNYSLNAHTSIQPKEWEVCTNSSIVSSTALWLLPAAGYTVSKRCNDTSK